MIELSLPQFFSSILILAVLGAGISLWIDRRRDRRRARAILRKTIRCRICSRAYPRTRAGGVQECPDCGRGNVQGRDRRLG